LEINRELRAKHDALLARLPSTSPNKLNHSRTNSSWSLSEDAKAAAFSPPPSPPAHRTPLNHTRDHSRRVSASPAALAFLAEQNDKLQSRISELENETNEADQSGKQKLRKLEKEIEALRSELELLEQRNGELEQKVQVVPTVVEEDEEAERLKLAKKERLRAFRRLSRTVDDDGPHYQDFAPSSSRSSIASVLTPRTKRTSGSPDDSPPLIPTPLSPVLSETELPSPGTSRVSTMRQSSGETAVVIQLLRKIEELERANQEFNLQHAQTDHKLRRVGLEADEMRIAYEGLEDEVNQGGWIDFPSIDSPLQHYSRPTSLVIPGTSTPNHIRHRSDSMERFSSVRSRASSGGLTTPKSTRSRHGLGNKAMYSKRARRPISQNLFSSPARSRSVSSVSRTQRNSLTSRLPPNPESPNPFLVRPDASTSRTRRLSALTPKLSLASATRAVSSLGSPSKCDRAFGSGHGKTLGSELGLASEFGDDWGNNVVDALFAEEADYEADDGGQNASFYSADEGENGQDLPPFEIDPAIAALEDAMEKRGRPLEQDEHILPVGCLRTSPPETFYQLNCAVTARPTRWVNVDSQNSQRLLMPNPDSTPLLSLLGPSTSEMADPWEATWYSTDIEEDAFADVGASPKKTYKRKPKDRLSRRNSALMRLNTAHQSRRLSMSSSGGDSDNEEEQEMHSFEVVQTPEKRETAEYQSEKARYDPVALAERLQRTSLKTFLEVWLLLQFVLVIGVFVYSTMRQGPRGVLGNSLVQKRKAN